MPGAPGDLGVLDAILVIALTPLYDAGAAVTSTIMLRLMTTAGDGLVFVIGLLLQRRAPA